MPTSEIIAYEDHWRDECLMLLCGFANAQGGTLYVGVDDQGKVVGVPNCDKLLEDLPNKINTSLGLIASVNRKPHLGLEYLEIKVPRSLSPISFHGEFYIRNGTANQKLSGMALVGFITRKTGVRWEDEVVDRVKVADLDEESFRIFRRKALKLGRLDEASLNLPNEELLKKLNLIYEGKLKRTAVLLFYKNPSIIQTGSVVQIAKFYEHGPEIHYQEVLNGSLITIADKIVDLIYWKYLKAKLIYEHDRSGDFYPFARTAVREAIINAIVHNCYMFGAPIQIRIEDEEMMISNSCLLPDDLTVETLLSNHRSLPYNPDLANVFYLAGYIEQWGRGIEEILTACRDWGTEPPVFKIQGNTFSVIFKALPKAVIKDPLVIIHAHGTLSNQNDTLGDTNGTLDDTNGTLDDTDRDTDRDTNVDLSKRKNILDDKILASLMEHPKITQKILAEQLGSSTITIKRATKRLVVRGRLRRVGSNRNGHWQVIN